MGLLELPTELIQRIVWETIPEDFENIAVLCKQLQQVSSIFLKQYNLRRKRYRHFALSIPHEITSRTGRGPSGIVKWDHATEETGIKVKSVPDLLLHIAEDPIIARYIQTLDIKNDQYYHEPRRQDVHDKSQPFYPHISDNPDPLSELMRRSPYLRDAGVDIEKWIERMVTDSWMDQYFLDSNFARNAVFLFTLLPNVTELVPDTNWGKLPSDPEMWKVLDLITRYANDKSKPYAAFSKLKAVKPCVGTGYERRGGLSSYTPFLALESLQEFYAGSCILYNDGYTGYAFEPHYEKYGSNLEKIELVGCVARFRELGWLLSRTPQLKGFHFAYETKWHGCGHNWNIGAFMNAIQESVGETLEELSVTILQCYGGTGTTLDNMKGFKRLRILELDVGMLLGPPFDKLSKNEEWLDEEGPGGDPAMPRLVDMLPESIEEVRLYNKDYDTEQIACVQRLFEGLEEERASKLPHLQQVELVSRETDSETTEDALRALQVVKDAGGTVILRQRLCNPWFAETFLERFGVVDW